MSSDRAPLRVTIIGIGGIGSHLADDVARYLADFRPGSTLTLVDGDVVQGRNLARQAFAAPGGNKAVVKQRELAERFSGIAVDAVPELCSPENAAFVVLDGEIILVCVDNHPTRKLVSLTASALARVDVIAGGNDLTCGNVFCYCRRDGVDITPPLTAEPAIAEARGKPPWELSCEELAEAGAEQILPTNVMAAAVMLAAFWRLVTEGDRFFRAPDSEALFDARYSRVDFDITACMMRSRQRAHITTEQQEKKEEAA